MVPILSKSNEISPSLKAKIADPHPFKCSNIWYWATHYMLVRKFSIAHLGKT